MSNPQNLSDMSVSDAPMEQEPATTRSEPQFMETTDEEPRVRLGTTPHAPSIPIPKHFCTIPVYTGSIVVTDLFISNPPLLPSGQADIPTPNVASNDDNAGSTRTTPQGAKRIIISADDHTISIYSLPDAKLLRKLIGHKGGVWSLAECRREGHDIIVSGSTDRTVRIWDVTSLDSPGGAPGSGAQPGEDSGGRLPESTPTTLPTHVFPGHTSTARCVAVIKPEWIDVEKDDGHVVKEKWPKRPLIISGSRDHTLRVWTLPKPGEKIYKPSKSTGGESPDDEEDWDDSNLDALIKENPYHRLHLKGHSNAIRDLDGQGRTVVSGSYDQTVRVWDIITGHCKLVLTGHTQKVYQVILDLPRNQIYSSSMDSTIRIWNLKTGETLHTLTDHTSLVGILSLSPSSSILSPSPNHAVLISAAADATLRVWDPTTGQLKQTFAQHTGAITCFHHDSTKVLSGCCEGLKLWDIRTGAFIKDIIKLNAVCGVWRVAFDERWAVVVYDPDNESGTKLDVWDFGEQQVKEGRTEDEDRDTKDWEIIEDNGDDDEADFEILAKLRQLQGTL